MKDFPIDFVSSLTASYVKARSTSAALVFSKNFRLSYFGIQAFLYQFVGGCFIDISDELICQGLLSKPAQDPIDLLFTLMLHLSEHVFRRITDEIHEIGSKLQYSLTKTPCRKATY